MPEDADLDALFESVASRERVDWERVEARAASPAQRSRLRALRDVARLAEFHQTLQRDVMPATGHKTIVRWGELLLLERVGSGASGEVYRAWDPALQREVALKLVTPRGNGARDAGDWLEEARALARVRDPHVVSVYGAGEHDGRGGLWMEFLHGPTLEAEIARRGPLPPGEVARLGVQLGSALRAVHAAGALHRDVKPANVILERGEGAVLTDFGLGLRRVAGQDSGPYSGTPLFMSPQRLAGAPARATDDLYALGVTLRCALTASPPYQAEALEALRQAASRGPVRPLRDERPDAPEALVAAIERAMASDPPSRFASAAELIAALEAIGNTLVNRRPTRIGPWLAAALAVAALAAWAVIAFVPRSKHDPTTIAPATPAAVAYDVNAGFLRRGTDGDTHLESGDRVAPGDRLSLEFRCTRPAWVYVLDADERGECYLLFPQPLFDRKNPLPPNSTVVLPGTLGGRENAWTVTSRGGREHLLVVAAPEPVSELERELSNLRAPVPGRPVSYARLTPGTVERLRGIGGVGEVVVPASPAGPAAIFERIQLLAGSDQGVRGIWVRQVTLENPAR